ncbi:hypothetical protein [Citrobacter portucalensis]|uniref:hypothetical protein n=1 Tax=Citrobacter portucalensis TaxID=1639133 RepID=UPI00226B7147|nr:hypothetical protein [Citrobacter portucalensis]MCX8986108.1 hypothetical protein [Citrobacter portucalensis]
MKKPSKRWKEFCQIIEIVDIRIGKQQRILERLRKEYQIINEKIAEKWRDIESEQYSLKNLYLLDEQEALSRMFRRRECIKSTIETLYFDVSALSQEAEELVVKTTAAEKEKHRLEKRKEAMGELLLQVKYE